MVTSDEPETDAQNTSTTVEAEESADPDWLPTWELIALPLGDFLTFLVFAAVGRASHGIGGRSAFLALFDTAVPFMLAFLVVGMLVGLYRGTALYPVGRVLWKTALAGIIAGPMGVALRALWLGRGIAPTFVLVGTLSSTVMLVIWRVTWSRLRRWWWPELP